MKTKVITYQAPSGRTLSVCDRHDPLTIRDSDGQEFCSVSHGRHFGFCDLAPAPDKPCPRIEAK